jgi:hypothetical protein
MARLTTRATGETPEVGATFAPLLARESRSTRTASTSARYVGYVVGCYFVVFPGGDGGLGAFSMRPLVIFSIASFASLLVLEGVADPPPPFSQPTTNENVDNSTTSNKKTRLIT